MKRLLLALLLLLPITALADFQSMNRSSFTATNDTTKRICSTPCVLAEVVVSSPSAGGVLSLYDSNGGATSQIGVVSLGTVQNYEFNVLISSGLTYSTTANSSGVTILWRK